MKRYLTQFSLVAAILFASPANAGLMFAGSWEVYDPAAPLWSGSAPNGPLAYSGQEAAALLFGGSSADYFISTIDDVVANINNMAWYDVIGFGKAMFAEDYSSKHLGLYYGPTSGYTGNLDGAASAFVRDNLQGQDAVNYAFRNVNSVPEPSVLSLFFAAGLVGVAARRRRAKKVVGII